MLIGNDLGDGKQGTKSQPLPLKDMEDRSEILNEYIQYMLYNTTTMNSWYH